MTDLIAAPAAFATEAHERIDQRRKYTNQPYQEHLKAVAELVAEVTDDAEMIAAAWLHDTVEDTPATFGDLERAFGRRGARAGRRPHRRQQAQRRQPRRAQGHRPPAHWRRHRRGPRPSSSRTSSTTAATSAPRRQLRAGLSGEAAALLDVLDDGDPRLYRRAQKVLAACAGARPAGAAAEPRTTTGLAAPRGSS
jgi:hypothetical protein